MDRKGDVEKCWSSDSFVCYNCGAFFKTGKVKLKCLPWFIGLILIVVIVLASFPAPTLLQSTTDETDNKVTYNAPFTLHFSQIMQQDSVEHAFQLIPETQGHFQWKDLRTLEFYPDSDLSIGDRYRIVIGHQARSLWMKEMGHDVAIEYQVTGPPYVLFTDPSAASVLKKDGSITVMFDRAMDWDQIDEKTLIKSDPTLEGQIRFMGMSAFQWTPTKPATEESYHLTIPAGLTALDGGITTEAYVWDLVTPSLNVSGSEPSDGVTGVPLTAPLRISFNHVAPLDAIKPGVNALLYPSNDLDAAVNQQMDGFFNTEVTYVAGETDTVEKDTLVFTPTFPYQPNTEYRFVLKADADLHLEDDFELTFKTLSEEAGGSPANGNDASEEAPQSLSASLWKDTAMTYFVRGEHPRLELKEAPKQALLLEVCQVSSNEFIRQSAGQGWQNYLCDEAAVQISPEQVGDDLILNLNDYFSYEWVTGVYYASLTQQGKKSPKLFLVEDSTLLLKRSDQDLLVWALDIKSGEPLPDMQLEILDYQGELITEGKTDEDGIFVIRKAFDQGIYVRGKQDSSPGRWGLVSDQWLLDPSAASPAEQKELYVLLNQHHFHPETQWKSKGSGALKVTISSASPKPLRPPCSSKMMRATTSFPSGFL